MFEHLIGKRSNKVINIVERGAVKKFAEAIGDPASYLYRPGVCFSKRNTKKILPRRLSQSFLITG